MCKWLKIKEISSHLFQLSSKYVNFENFYDSDFCIISPAIVVIVHWDTFESLHIKTIFTQHDTVCLVIFFLTNHLKNSIKDTKNWCPLLFFMSKKMKNCNIFYVDCRKFVAVWKRNLSSVLYYTLKALIIIMFDLT